MTDCEERISDEYLRQFAQGNFGASEFVKLMARELIELRERLRAINAEVLKMKDAVRRLEEEDVLGECPE